MAMTRRGALGAAGLLAAPRLALAQAIWPSRPVTIVVPYAPGGGTDIFARAVAEGMREAIGQPVVVENRAGANGVVGGEYVLRSAPDGHMLMVATGAHVINRYSMPNIPFDPVRDFTPIAMLSGFPLVLAANAKLSFDDIAGLIAAARARPGSIAFSSTEAATSYAGNAFARQAGIQADRGAVQGQRAAAERPGRRPRAARRHQHGRGAAACRGRHGEGAGGDLDKAVRAAAAGADDGGGRAAGYEFNGWYGMYAPPGMPASLAQLVYSLQCRRPWRGRQSGSGCWNWRGSGNLGAGALRGIPGAG